MKGFRKGDLVVYCGRQTIFPHRRYRDGNPVEVLDVNERGSILISGYIDYLVEEVFKLYQPESLENK